MNIITHVTADETLPLLLTTFFKKEEGIEGKTLHIVHSHQPTKPGTISVIGVDVAIKLANDPCNLVMLVSSLTRGELNQLFQGKFLELMKKRNTYFVKISSTSLREDIMKAYKNLKREIGRN